MTMLKHTRFEPELTERALKMLLIDRQNEFRELANVMRLSSATSKWEEFILNFCLDVDEIFKTWSGKKEITQQTDIKSMTIMRQLSRGKSSMIEVTHLLNIAYTLAQEFKEVYRRFEE